MSEVNALLLELQIAEGCTYLLDLHIGGRLNDQVKSQILAIPLERYSLQEWNEAAVYITGVKRHYLLAEEARASILGEK